MRQRARPLARRMRSASSATLRREATISASVSSAGATGELLTPVETGMPRSVAAAKSSMCELRPTSAISLSFGSRSSSARENSTRSRIDTTTSASFRRSTSSIEIARRLAMARHVVVADQREAGKLIDHVLIVVGDDDFHRRFVLLLQRRPIRSAARPITSPRSTSSCTASASSSGRTTLTSGNTSPRATSSSNSSTSLRVT